MDRKRIRRILGGFTTKYYQTMLGDFGKRLKTESMQEDSYLFSYSRIHISYTSTIDHGLQWLSCCGNRPTITFHGKNIFFLKIHVKMCNSPGRGILMVKRRTEASALSTLKICFHVIVPHNLDRRRHFSIYFTKRLYQCI